RVAVAAAAAAAVATVIVDPWQSDPAVASAPAVLDYALANARAIADAPGEPAGPTLLDLAAAAEDEPRVARPGPHQYVLTDNWFASLDTEDTARLVPQQRESWFRD